MQTAVVELAPCLVPDAAELEKRCFSQPWSATAISESLNSGNVCGLALFDGHRLAGYALMQAICGEGELLRIAVAPEHRRRGYAKALMSALLDKAREIGLEKIALEVRASNTSAAALYAHAGFKVDGLRKGYYQDPAEDGILMSRSVDVR